MNLEICTFSTILNSKHFKYMLGKGAVKGGRKEGRREESKKGRKKERRKEVVVSSFVEGNNIVQG